MQTNAPLFVQFDGFAEDLLQERATRPLIIVGASRVDELLLSILSSYLLPKVSKTKDADELLEGDRPLSTFSARSKLCYRLGLIDRTLYDCMEKLRSLRNKCAHSVLFDISQSPLREHYAELRKNVSARSSYKLTQERYFDMASLSAFEELQCTLLTLCVLLEAAREQIKTTSGCSTTLSITSK
jgi:hypothetical protein